MDFGLFFKMFIQAVVVVYGVALLCFLYRMVKEQRGEGMKLLVDEMPYWINDCPFYDGDCRIDRQHCDYMDRNAGYRIEEECRWLAVFKTGE